MSTTDARRSGFFTIDNEILTVHGATIGVYGLAVYTALAQHANSAGRCHPTIPRIAGILDCSPRKVNDALRLLADAGLIAIEERRAKNGRQMSNAYVLLPVAKVEATPQPPQDVQGTPQDVQGEGAGRAGGRVHHMHPNKTQKEQDPSFAYAQEGSATPGADAPDATTGRDETTKPAPARRSPKPKAPPDPRIRELLRAFETWQGYTACNWAAEARHAKRIIDAGYTLDDARTVWRSMKAEPFWQDKHLSLANVFTQLGAKLGGPNGRKRDVIVLEPIRRGGDA